MSRKLENPESNDTVGTESGSKHLGNQLSNINDKENGKIKTKNNKEINETKKKKEDKQKKEI